MVIWLIGAPGSGKTTIGKVLHEKLKDEDPHTVIIDGDFIRQLFSNDLGYCLEDRRKNGKRIQSLCHFLDKQEIDVVCCVMSIFPEHQLENRKLFTDYFQLFIDIDRETLMRRDQKGLYTAAQRGEVNNVVGFDIPFVQPVESDLVINNSGAGVEPGEAAEAILSQLRN